MLAQIGPRAGAALLLLLVAAWVGARQLEHRRGPAATKPAAHYAAGQVAYVTDGDTINVSGVGNVRFLGIDAPETRDNSHGPKGCYGITAKKRLAELLPAGTSVELVTENRIKDKYGRTLAYVEAGGADVGEQMMREGMVDFYRDGSGIVVPFGRQSRYEQAWAEAERAPAGIHRVECAP